ncbi:hypothetical protein EJ02DRAFT_510967 [Clathrospora elynae]|uniref:Nephrocystin 3-like N-terminal domain-containing protein n=1 Tax=Clathrospora elynae TaxID=706981 RepID=A0A6A5SU97_9PLEO|nr:hypothetical protein EJ02DRAFT_510967 [Clathrospora elynae]
MTKPIPAVGLASALIQTIAFSIQTLRKDHPIAQPTDPSTPPVESAAFLQDIIHNLFRLTDLIETSELKTLHDEKSGRAAKKLSEPAQQLLKHAEVLVKELTNPLILALIAAQENGKSGDGQWGSAREALMLSGGGVWKKGDVTGAKKKFRALRKDVDTSLLLAMGQYLDQSAETGLPVFSSEENGVGVRHWERWQNEALDLIHAHKWKSSKKKNVEEFSKVVDKLVVAEQETVFLETVFKRLWFEELDERVNSIPNPADGGFEFVFGDSARQVGGLLEWFGSRRGEGVFWITGKPGTGKTTLLKYLFRNPLLFPHLEAWSGTHPGITSGFFFWASGTELQNSPLSLLRSIIYESLQDMIFGPLEQDQSVIQHLFPDRWNAFQSYAGGLHAFTFPELRKTFEVMISDTEKKFLFMVDGLDEMDDYPNELVDLILSASKKDNVKFLLSSRSSPVFQSAFETRPRLVLEEYTKPDIQTYVTSAFNLEPKLESLRGKMDGKEELTIVSTLSEKSSGIFLWASLATSFLLGGLEEDDDFLILKDRAEALPYQLDDLLAHILNKLKPSDLEALWKLHTLLGSANSCPAILPLSFAFTAESSVTLAADVSPLKPAEAAKRVDDMHIVLNMSCKNLISVFDTSAPGQHARSEDLRVTYTHRTISDYLYAYPGLLKKIPTVLMWSPTQQWADAHLWVLKTMQQQPSTPTATATPASLSSSSFSSSTPLALWTPLSSALSAASTLFSKTNIFPQTYVHAALTTSVFLHLKSATSSDLPQFPSSSGSSTPLSATTLTTSFDLAVLLNLSSYIALKAKTTDRKDIRHAIDFSREMRKRLGVGGMEELWLSGRGNEKLRAEYGKGRGEVDALLEYYVKVVRFGTTKPHINVPEYV